MLTEDVRKFMDASVLCWLATADEDGQPNVSPKEMFLYQDDHSLLIAHINSPHTVRNIRVNPKVCVSFVEVFVQKGYKLHGMATLIEPGDGRFEEKKSLITAKYGDRFQVKSVMEIVVTKVAPILAPSYVFFKDETTEEGQIRSARKTYGVD